MAAADNDRPEGADAELGRRVLLRGMAAMGLAAVTLPLAACGNDDEPEAVAATPEATPEATVEATPKATAKATKSPKPAKTAEATPKATKSAQTAEAEATPTPKATPKETTKKLVKASDTPLASTTDIPVNHGVLFESEGYIVTQPKAGQFIGFDDKCTHEGCEVDQMDNPGEMDCTCHDSKFRITDGSVISGPARKPLPKKPILVEGGKIYKAKEA